MQLFSTAIVVIVPLFVRPGSVLPQPARSRDLLESTDGSNLARAVPCSPFQLWNMSNFSSCDELYTCLICPAADTALPSPNVLDGLAGAVDES
jgi:hypothetical protein